MVFFLLVILLIFVIGLIVSKKSIRHVFFSGIRFILITFAAIAAVIWIFCQRDNAGQSKATHGSYDHSAYLRAQQKQKEDALKVGNELLKITKTLFHDEMCYRIWGETNEVISEVYRKYKEDLEGKDISSIELLTLIDEGFTEVGGNEVVIFQRDGWSPVKSPQRNETVRKATVPLSQYYYGPASCGVSSEFGL